MFLKISFPCSCNFLFMCPSVLALMNLKDNHITRFSQCLFIFEYFPCIIVVFFVTSSKTLKIHVLVKLYYFSIKGVFACDLAFWYVIFLKTLKRYVFGNAVQFFQYRLFPVLFDAQRLVPNTFINTQRKHLLKCPFLSIYTVLFVDIGFFVLNDAKYTQYTYFC